MVCVIYVTKTETHPTIVFGLCRQLCNRYDNLHLTNHQISTTISAIYIHTNECVDM